MGKLGPTGFSHPTETYKDNYANIFGKQVKTMNKVKKEPAVRKTKRTVVEQSKPSKSKSMKDSMLSERNTAEKVNVALNKRLVPEVIQMSKLTEEQQRKLIFDTFPGDELGLTTGKVHHDAYDAMKPVPDSTKN